MKFATLMTISLLAAGCATSGEHRYAGSPGSVYDKAQEPPHEFPPSGYDPVANDAKRRAAETATR